MDTAAMSHPRRGNPSKRSLENEFCVYCAWDADVWDHLRPVSWTGSAQHASTKQVPACTDCNTRLGDAYAATIEDRREWIATQLRRKHARLLRSPEWTQRELDELSGTMRITIENKQLLKKITQFRLDNLSRYADEAPEIWESYVEE